MKKIMAILLAVLVLVLALVGCAAMRGTVTNSETEEDETILAAANLAATEQKEDAGESVEKKEETVQHIHIWVPNTETVTHEAEGHYETVDVPAWDEQVVVKAAWDENILVKEAWDETVTVPAWDEKIITKEAWDEKVLVKDAWDETIETPAWDEQVLVKPAVTQKGWFCKSVCNKCGATFVDGPVFSGTSAPISGAAHNNERMLAGDPCHGITYSSYSADVEIEPAEYKTVHHDATYTTVHHDAEYTTVHHDAEHTTIHHNATTKTVHHEAEYETVRHEAEYETVHHDACTQQQWVEDVPTWDETVTNGHKCRECGQIRE